MKQPLSDEVLRRENQLFVGSGGLSEQNRAHRFVPAFYDTQSRKAAASCFANGTPAPMHVLEGLPREWVVQRDTSGRVVAVKESVIAGFLYQGAFYTREQAALAVHPWNG
jgi:hypothetical protein